MVHLSRCRFFPTSAFRPQTRCPPLSFVSSYSGLPDLSPSSFPFPRLCPRERYDFQRFRASDCECWGTKGCGDANSAAPATPEETGLERLRHGSAASFGLHFTDGSRTGLHPHREFCGSRLSCCYAAVETRDLGWSSRDCLMRSLRLSAIAAVASASTTA